MTLYGLAPAREKARALIAAAQAALAPLGARAQPLAALAEFTIQRTS